MILIGTSGFSYDDWRGTWYPAALPKARMLDYYASVFNALEINSTYYGTPGAASARGMLKSAAGRVQFAVKAPGDVTHRGLLGADVLLPFRRFVEPFHEAEKLSAILLQFPNSFHAMPRTWEFLHAASIGFAGLPLVVELRHASWDTNDADTRLAEMKYSRATVDQPAIKGLSKAGRTRVTGPIAYFRFHGRNAAAWYGGDEQHIRYDYKYAREELLPTIPFIREAGERAQTTQIFFNNHPHGFAPADAAMLAEMLGQPISRQVEGDLFE